MIFERFFIRIAVAGLCAVVFSASGHADENTPTPELLRLGQSLYKLHCAICHGVDGEGDGSLAREFDPPPRDFTQGLFKFISTENGDPPARIDILRVIERGIDGSYGRSMPAFPGLSISERLALAEVVRQFGGIARYGAPVPLPPRPAADPQRSAQLYEDLGCADCHGATGAGDGPAAADLVDMDGNPIRPANFMTGKFKGGNSPEDIWRRVYSGVAGTPMPSFGQNVSDNDIWLVTIMVTEFGSN